MLTPGQVGAQPFDPAQRHLRMNRAAARFTSSAPTEYERARGRAGILLRRGYHTLWPNQRHARQASRQARRRQAAAPPDGLGTRDWLARISVVAGVVLFLLTFYRWGRRFRIERR